jgi:ubiquinone/menaquinone biosynthesis C-methylase UbiE
MNEIIGSSFVVPDTVVSHFNIMDGDSVADFGAGSGFFLKAIASRCGSGKIYACEIQKMLVERIGELARSLNLQNVSPLWCDLEEPQGIKIPSGAVDVGILSNTLFQIENKEVAITEMGRVIRSGGKLFVIDWSDTASGAGPRPEAVVAQADAIHLCEAHGFIYERDYPAGSHHYGLAFRKI